MASFREPQILSEPRTLEGASPTVESILEETERAQLELPSGRRVEARAEGSGEERVTVRSASGEVELEVRFTERGPLLRFRAADLELSSPGEVRVDCDRLELRAKKEIDALAGSLRFEAERGDVEIEANDDVRLLGERIKMNC